jgi:phosphatidylethanolamine-binding protein (PEBP) family uncharacterized protein
MRVLRFGVAILLVAAVAGCGDKDTEPPSAPDDLTISSPAFSNDGTIPTRFTCDGDGPPPPLSWSGVPDDAKELVLLVEDPDAPGGVFVHWVLPHLDPASTSLPAGGDGWRPPCPPEGDKPHHYRFNLYALKRTTGLTTDSGGEDAHQAIEDAGALARGQLTGLYSRG